ncbi:MAG TPA: hypothetical protein VJV79_07900 [Polyangiaceae bacterium]|nr:hypothetical protein [Polyangiaceae bacterium]
MTELVARARARYAKIQRQRRDPRYRRVVGRLIGAGLLSTNDGTIPHRNAIGVADALWAGELEPRILELLPALLIKRPSLFEDATVLPDDLAHVVRALRRAEVPPDFRGISGADLARWLPRLGRSGTVPSRLRCFRFSADESRLLSQLGRELHTTEVAVLRRALRELGAAVLKERATSEEQRDD